MKKLNNDTYEKNRSTQNESLELAEIKQLIGFCQPLSRSIELELIKKSKDGCESATTKLIQSNIAYIFNIAKKYTQHNMPISDLVSNGIIGLLAAINGFDTSKDRSLRTYATLWIKHYILKCITDESRVIRLPAHLFIKRKKYLQAEASLQKTQKFHPTDKQIAEICDLTERQVHRLRNTYANLFVQQDLGLEDNSQAEFFLSEKAKEHYREQNRQYTDFDIKTLIRRAISTLNDKQSKVLLHTYGLYDHPQHSLKEIAAELKLTVERVRQLIKEAKLKVETYLNRYGVNQSLFLDSIA